MSLTQLRNRPAAQTILLLFLGALVVTVLAVRMSQSYDRWQGDEGSYLTFATRVADGHLPYVDWSPGFALAYAPFFSVGLEGPDAQLAIRITSAVALLLIFGFTIHRTFRNPWITVIFTLAIAAHPMLSVGMSLRVFTAALVALVLLASTHERKGAGLALIVIAAATLIRPEFWIMYALVLAAVLIWYRRRTSVPLIVISIAVALASWTFLQLGPLASDYPGGRALQAIGQHYAVFDATPGVDPWNEWGVPFRRDFGDATTAVQMYRNNQDRFVAYVSSNLRSVPDITLRAYRYSDRLTISRLTGALIAIAIVSAGIIYVATTRKRGRGDHGESRDRRVSFTILVSVTVFAMMLPWVITGTDSMIAAPFSPAILLLLAASTAYLWREFKRRRQSKGEAGS